MEEFVVSFNKKKCETDEMTWRRHGTFKATRERGDCEETTSWLSPCGFSD